MNQKNLFTTEDTEEKQCQVIITASPAGECACFSKHLIYSVYSVYSVVQ